MIKVWTQSNSLVNEDKRISAWHDCGSHHRPGRMQGQHERSFSPTKVPRKLRWQFFVHVRTLQSCRMRMSYRTLERYALKRLALLGCIPMLVPERLWRCESLHRINSAHLAGLAFGTTADMLRKLPPYPGTMLHPARNYENTLWCKATGRESHSEVAWHGTPGALLSCDIRSLICIEIWNVTTSSACLQTDWYR